MVSLTYVTLIFTVFMAATAMAQSDDSLETDNKGICNPSCPLGWLRFDGRCYKYQSDKMDWASAEKHCLSLGAHLVSIHNEFEQKLVQSMVNLHSSDGDITWIGLSDCQQRNNWFWSDGTGLTFTQWHPHRPNIFSNHCCVVMSWSDAKNWNHFQCGEKNSFICAKKITIL